VSASGGAGLFSASGPFCNGGDAMSDEPISQLTQQANQTADQFRAQQQWAFATTPDYRKLLELEELIRKLSREITLIRSLLEKEKTNAP
jgi:hypothetical protein